MHLGQRAEQRKTSRILVRFRKSLVKLLALVILVLMMIPSIPAHAVPAYLPGVHVGDSVTFGQVSGNVAPFSDTKSIVETVMGVNGATVEVSQTYNLKNGTSQTTFGTVDVQTGAGSSMDLVSLKGATFPLTCPNVTESPTWTPGRYAGTA